MKMLNSITSKPKISTFVPMRMQTLHFMGAAARL
jgi:hypothetical protein